MEFLFKIRINEPRTADNSATSLFKWHGIYFDNTQNFVQVKLRIRIEESRGSTEPLQNPPMDIGNSQKNWEIQR